MTQISKTPIRPIGCPTPKTERVISGALIVKEAGARFENVRFDGAVTVTAKGAVFLGCHFAAPLLDRGTGTVVENCTLAALSTAAAHASYRYNTVGEARVEGARNLLLAKNRLSTLAVAGGDNLSILCNAVGDLAARECRHLYICDNEIEGDFSAEENVYFIADGNRSRHTPRPKNNENINGDTLTDVDARLECGANERLLPHVDPDQFVGMERLCGARDPQTGETQAVYDYITAQAAREREVFLVPGAYTADTTLCLGEAHSDTVIYAYGVYVEMIQHERDGKYWRYRGHFVGRGARDLSLRGLTVGYREPSCAQVFVLEKLADPRSLRLVCAAGMPREFGTTDPAHYLSRSIGVQRAGTIYAVTDANYDSITREADGTLLMRVGEWLYDRVFPGDILTCKSVAEESSFVIWDCDGLSYRDVTVYGNTSGACFVENFTRRPTEYYRVLDTTRSGEIISREEYERHRALEEQYGISLEISRDALGRYRGAPAHLGSVDATHVARCENGSRVISCLFENMCDDGTNQKSNHARLAAVEENGDGTVTLVYKANFAEAYYRAFGQDFAAERVCTDFEIGHRVLVYTAGGQRVCDTLALSATHAYPPRPSAINGKPLPYYGVRVSREAVNFAALTGYDLSDDGWDEGGKVFLDNMSRASGNFLFDNTLVQNVRSRGLLIKSSDGVVKNCTFRNIAKVAIGAIYEAFYGESGISENLVIEKNLIDHAAFALCYSPLYKHYAINIAGLGGKSAEEDHLLYRNIVIRGNRFINRVHVPHPEDHDPDQNAYAVYLQATCGVELSDNDFGQVEGYPSRALRLSGAADITLSGNRYAPGVSPRDSVGGETYRGLHGADISDMA